MSFAHASDWEALLSQESLGKVAQTSTYGTISATESPPSSMAMLPTPAAEAKAEEGMPLPGAWSAARPTIGADGFYHCPGCDDTDGVYDFCDDCQTTSVSQPAGPLRSVPTDTTSYSRIMMQRKM
mmetsp:Transcript_27017/g.68707  ORF Transcript_27017/g.68707 Transcript_27017/m.68707 type:complete len:125 (-) Transcript_27017:399-773(-)